MNEDNLIKELGRSYIVSSFLPSAFFVSIIFLLFRGFIPHKLISELETNNVLLVGAWVIASIFTTWIAFFLFSSVDWIVKLFEGYYFPSSLQKYLSEQYKNKIKKRAISFFEINKVMKKPVSKRTTRDEKIYDRNWGSALGELQDLEIETPIDDNDFMPTRLGNVLKASEVYAYDRYFIEAITIWPRLFSLLPSGFVKDMEEKNNHFMFLLNSTLLIYFSFGLSILSSLLGFYYKSCKGLFFCNILQGTQYIRVGYSVISPQLYLIISVILILFGYRLYLIAVNAAQDFSLFYRAGFDLYRIDLLKQLQRDLPKNLGDERNEWLALSKFFVAGEKIEWDLDRIEYPKYHYHKVDPIKKESDNER